MKIFAFVTSLFFTVATQTFAQKSVHHFIVHTTHSYASFSAHKRSWTQQDIVHFNFDGIVEKENFFSNTNATLSIFQKRFSKNIISLFANCSFPDVFEHAHELASWSLLNDYNDDEQELLVEAPFVSKLTFIISF